jgi:hypothetical protein
MIAASMTEAAFRRRLAALSVRLQLDPGAVGRPTRMGSTRQWRLAMSAFGGKADFVRTAFDVL